MMPNDQIRQPNAAGPALCPDLGSEVQTRKSADHAPVEHGRRSPSRARLFARAAGVAIVLVVAAAAVHLAGMMRPVPPADVGAVKVTANGRYRAQLAPNAPLVPIGRLHRWTLRVEHADGTPVTDLAATIDGGMPQHGHGLPTQPRVTGSLPDGQLVIDGMKFSMTGWWQLQVRVSGDAGTDSVAFNLIL